MNLRRVFYFTSDLLTRPFYIPNHFRTLAVIRSLVDFIWAESRALIDPKSWQWACPSRITTGVSELTFSCTPIGRQGSSSPCVKNTFVSFGLKPLCLRLVFSIFSAILANVNLQIQISIPSVINCLLIYTHSLSNRSAHSWMFKATGNCEPKSWSRDVDVWNQPNSLQVW